MKIFKNTFISLNRNEYGLKVTPENCCVAAFNGLLDTCAYDLPAGEIR